MAAFVVSCRRVGAPFQSSKPVEGVFATEAEARAYAVRMNCKPFTPFFFFVERVA